MTDATRREETPDVSVVIVNYNTAHLIDRAVADARASAGRYRLQFILIDNASRDGSAAHMREVHADCDLVFNERNVGFGRANNQALPMVRGRYVLLLNTDAFVQGDTLARTVAYMDAHPQCGILGARLIGEDGSLQPSCRYFPTPLNQLFGRYGLAQRLRRWVRPVDDLVWPHDEIRSCDWVPGCYYLVRRQVLDQVGLFDPRYFMYFEEVDHCRATKRGGWEVVYFPAPVIHVGGESAKSDPKLGVGRQISALQVESEFLYFRKHYGLSGAWFWMVSTSLGDACLALLRLLRRRSTSALRQGVAQMGQTLRIARATRVGAHPTR